jgi:hypothetical protein
MTPERLAEIEQIMNRYGSANCWTGTSGMLAAIIWELIQERKNGKNKRDVQGVP